MHSAIEHCLRTAPVAAGCETVAQWWAGTAGLQRSWPVPIDRSIAGGFAADRVAWAFAGAYQDALRVLVPGLASDRMAAFCVTETTGNRPRDVQTRVTVGSDTLVLDGAKRWTTLGPDSATLLVVARLATPDDSERIALRVVQVPTDAAGVVVTAMPPTRFVPEVAHASVRFEQVRLPLQAMLPGDGYDDYTKPFRSIEDTHVTAAVLACLLREARARGWPQDWPEQALLVLQGLVAVAADAPSAPGAHLMLAGAMHLADRLFGEADTLFARVPDDPAAQRWQRDRALLGVAASARAQRTQRAWERLAG